MRRVCRSCSNSFDIDPSDEAFLKRVSPTFGVANCPIPLPTLCPECRLFRRLCYRNDDRVTMHFSAFGGESVFSQYFGVQQFPVISNAEWWGDSWDGLEFGRQFDPNRTFFEQWRALRDVVPMPSVSVLEFENSPYCNNASHLKNCYLTFNATASESCFYCENVGYCKDCLDCTLISKCVLCYDCIDCLSCYNLQSSEHSHECVDSFFLVNCRGCNDCFGCVNLRKKRYCVFNEQRSAAQYREFIDNLSLSSHTVRQQYRQKLLAFVRQQPRPHFFGSHTEEVSGDYINRSKMVHDSYMVDDGEHVRYGFSLVGGIRDSADISQFGHHVELCYECAIIGHDCYRDLFCYDTWKGCRELIYCNMCPGCSNCFGCVGLRRKSFCILNKQYSEAEYNTIVPKIIEHMEQARQWGEFFPAQLTPFPFNFTLAAHYWPLIEGEARELGFGWSNAELAPPEGVRNELPDSLPDNDEPFVAKSEHSGRPYRITAEELRRYRELRVPLPRLTYDERIAERWKRRGGFRLYDRRCAKSGAMLRTTVPPTSEQVVWNKELYDREFT